MDQMENSLLRKSQIRPPSRIPSPGKALYEISESQSNTRVKPSMLPPATSVKSSLRPTNEPEPKRKTLAERAGEPTKSSVAAPPRPTVKATSLVGAASGITGARNTSFASSTSSRSTSSSRNVSNSSFSSSVGPGSRPPSSFVGRPQTAAAFSQSTTSRPTTSMTMKRPATAMDDHLEGGGGPSDGKRKAWDMRGRLEDVEAMYSALKDTVASTTAERHNLEDAVSQYKSRLKDLESKNVRLNATIESLEWKNSALESKVAAQQMDADILRQQVLTGAATVEDERRRHRNELEDQGREHLYEVEKIKRQLTEELERLERAHQRDSAEDVDRLKRIHSEELRELQLRSQDQLESERRQRLHEVQEVKVQIAVEQQNLDMAVGTKDREIQTMRGQLEELRGELDREQTLKASLQKKLSESLSAGDSLEGTVRSLRDRVQFLESGSKAQSDRFVSMEKQLEEAQGLERVWKEKLIKEETLRRILFNQVQELKGNIRVMCRVRPAFDVDRSDSLVKIAYPDLEKESKELELQGPEEKSSLGTVTRKTNAFSFDRVFGPESQNEEVFGEISQLVQSAMDGFNVCIFCYGQTGSGKTHTMSSADGMIPRATHMIYERAESLKEKGWTYTMEGNFVEVYNEDIHDLLGNPKEFDKKKHDIRHDEQKKQTSVTNLKTVELDSADAVEMILQQAAANRSVAATKSNERSSRSHSVFILKLVGKNSTTNEVSEGTLNLVDLAGSERLKQSGAEGDRMKETQNINKSLSCLGDVIGALGQGKEGAHIPYRNSKLTYLLQYSLGGNSKTLMFVMISPLETHVKETLTSLKFATKVHNTHIGTAKKSTKVRE